MPIPVPAWSETSPVLIELFRYDDLEEAVRQQHCRQRQQTLRRKREFLEHWLTLAERFTASTLLGRFERNGREKLAVLDRLYRIRYTVLSDDIFAALSRVLLVIITNTIEGGYVEQ